jgi:23S rRNA-/tRNA-specific pseudouridylate synthase
MHCREGIKPTATGPLALAALKNSELFVHGRPGDTLDLNPLFDAGRRVLLLFPGEFARPLSAELMAEDPRPITLIVPDGNWRQASRIPKRVPGLERAEQVTLATGAPTRWGLRRETRAEGLSTFEAIARAFGVLESAEVQAGLEALFDTMVEVGFAARGYDREGAPQGSSAEPKALPILYQDEHFVAVNKPAGMLVHRGRGADEPFEVQRLEQQFGALYAAHNPDRPESGVLLFARSEEKQMMLRRDLESGQASAHYLAICDGIGGSWEVSESRAGSSESFLWKLRGSFEGFGLFELQARGQSKHYLRRRLKQMRLPVIGDVRYGSGATNREFRERFRFHRLALHCTSVTLTHPVSGQALHIEAPLDEAFAGLYLQLQQPQEILKKQ